MVVDAQLFFALNSLAGVSPFTDGVIVFFAKYLAYLLGILFLVLLTFSSYSKREKREILFVAVLSSLIARFGVTEGIRYFFHRPRPFIDLSVPHLLSEQSWSWSFPSGHATFFFALSTAVYLYNKRWGSLFFAATALMTVSRVIAGVHYPSDIVFGALIGVAVALATYALTRYFLPKEANQNLLTE